MATQSPAFVLLLKQEIQNTRSNINNMDLWRYHIQAVSEWASLAARQSRERFVNLLAIDRGFFSVILFHSRGNDCFSNSRLLRSLRRAFAFGTGLMT